MSKMEKWRIFCRNTFIVVCVSYELLDKVFKVDLGIWDEPLCVIGLLFLAADLMLLAIEKRREKALFWAAPFAISLVLAAISLGFAASSLIKLFRP